MEISIQEFLTDREKYSNSKFGVGLSFTGIPTCTDIFIDALEDDSCPPVIARMICDDLISNGKRITTVMNRLNFALLEKKMNHVGVEIKIVDPIDIEKSNQREKLDLAHSALKHIRNKTEDNKNFYYTEGIRLMKKYGNKINRKWK